VPRVPVTSDRLPEIGAAPFSFAVSGAPQLFLSGLLGVDYATRQLVGESTEEQAEQALRNLLLLVTAAGRSEADVLRVQLYLTDMSDYAVVNAVYERLFSSPYPARTAIGVAALPMGARFEVDAVVG
jgi:reactive intermediate/imine deaminase